MYSEFSETSTSCSKMRAAIATARMGSRGLSAVHISGPAGTGKTSLAKFMHISGRPHARILTVDSNQLTAQTVQRILPEKSPATLLIENVDGLSQEGIEFVRTLLTNRIAIDLKIITTSRRDLRSLTRRGFFPDDLFYKLTSIFIELPEITKRGLDFEQLVYFNINVQSLLQSKPGLSISKEALSKLKSWHWPGNISELECVIERAAALAEKNQITEEHIIFEDVEICVDQFGAGMTLSEMEKRLILQTLQITSQNKTKAARMLGISIRTLRNKLNEYRHGGGV